jgi:hypothetical protein
MSSILTHTLIFVLVRKINYLLLVLTFVYFQITEHKQYEYEMTKIPNSDQSQTQ